MRVQSGKSSIILLLLRLLDPLSRCRESLTIDGIPLYRIDRSTLRDRFITIPQEPSFLPDGTSFLLNLDPYRRSNEGECESALETVGLWTAVQRQGGLQAGLFYSSLSQGQKQLFSLARAVLKRRVRATEQVHVNGVSAGNSSLGGVLLVDEVSSTVDADTERTIQTVIQRDFETYTVVMVSHRLEMVNSFDKLLVIDRGAIIETGRPEVLIHRAGGVFRNCGR
jgi:ABC-type multidrug transport system fused ATPase/permease subunit